MANAIINFLAEFLKSFGVWGWLELVAAAIVAFGCLGELWIEINKLTQENQDPPKTSGRIWRVLFWFDSKLRPLVLKLKIRGRKIPQSKEKLLERLFIALVAAGVTLEVVGITGSLRETSTIMQDAEYAKVLASAIGTTNAQLWAANLVLQTNVNETKTHLANAEARLNESILNLKKENLPMDIGDQNSFGNALKPIAGIQVELRSAVDTKAQETAESLFSAFFMAECPVINRAFIGDIGEQGVVIGYGDDNKSKQAAFLLLRLLIERGVPSKVIDDPNGRRVRNVPTNAIIVAVMKRPAKLEADLIIVQAKQEILSVQETPVFSRMMELSSKRYFGAKELAEAQSEYNDLNSQYVKLEDEKKNLQERYRNLREKVDEEIFGTNSTGIHMLGSVFNNMPPGSSPIKIVGAGTNSPKIFMRDTHINPVPLQ